MRVLGLDVSANRVAWAICDGAGTCSTDRIMRHKDSFAVFIESSATEINDIMADNDLYVACLEINLHPKLTHKGHPSATMVNAYMRSRWIEGGIIYECFHEEPQMIERIRGGFHKIPPGQIFSMQASGRVGTKEKEDRRRRMSAHYGGITASEDEIDALAIAHECVVALKTGIRKEQSK